jgi:hypothetical protein
MDPWKTLVDDMTKASKEEKLFKVSGKANHKLSELKDSCCGCNGNIKLCRKYKSLRRDLKTISRSEDEETKYIMVISSILGYRDISR